MSTLKHFYFISELGRTNLPDKAEISRLLDEKDQEVTLLLDSSVCLDIVDIIRKKRDSQADKNKVFNLIEYVQKTKARWTPICALIELCYDRETYEIKEDKLWDFKNKLDFAFQYPLKFLKRFEYDYETNYKISEKRKLPVSSIKPVTENLNCYYAALLKMRAIARINLKQEMAEKNIEEFVDWMINDLGVLLGLEYSLALKIFGGDTEFRPMLKLESSKEKSLKAIWGSAWDLFHARISRNQNQLSQLLGQNVHPIFVTKDGRLFELLAPHVQFHVKTDSSRLTVTDKNDYPPHYSQNFMDYLNIKILKLGVARFPNEVTINDHKINSMIKKLEDA